MFSLSENICHSLFMCFGGGVTCRRFDGDPTRVSEFSDSGFPTKASITNSLRHSIGSSFPLEDIAAAHELVESGTQIGKM
jgi:hypothetical protein